LVDGWYKMHLTDAGLDENSMASSFPEEVEWKNTVNLIRFLPKDPNFLLLPKN
jgi:hypothetical protein